MTANSFNACFVKIEHTPTRGVYKVILEIPEEQANHVLNALGGLPSAKDSTWVKVSRIQDAQNDLYQPGEYKLTVGNEFVEPAPEKYRVHIHGGGGSTTSWHDMKPSQQAGIRCIEPAFQNWILSHAKWGGSVSVGYIDGGFKKEAFARACIIFHCKINSRSELDINPTAAAVWHEIDKDFIWHLQHEVNDGE